MTHLTALAQTRLQQHLKRGDRVIDATAGNGHDTLFLARQVLPEGAVMAFDIQEKALQNTRQRLRQQGIDAVILQHGGHENMQQLTPPDWLGTVSAIVFNLGYLPGSDKKTATEANTTVAALEASTHLLKRGGCLSILVYRGHPGAESEAEAVSQWLTLQNGYVQETFATAGPILYLLSKT